MHLTNSLNILGISELEEKAYRWLVTQGNGTVAEARKVLGVSALQIQRRFERLEHISLATHSPERP